MVDCGRRFHRATTGAMAMLLANIWEDQPAVEESKLPRIAPAGAGDYTARQLGLPLPMPGRIRGPLPTGFGPGYACLTEPRPSKETSEF